jgi:hypothetical protein
MLCRNAGKNLKVFALPLKDVNLSPIKPYPFCSIVLAQPGITIFGYMMAKSCFFATNSATNEIKILQV